MIMETKPKRILLIDDDEELCEELAGILDEEGYQVTIATEGSIGKKMLDKNVYELILLDIKMPGFSGVELLKYAKEKKKPGKFVMITGGAAIDETTNTIKVAIPNSEQQIIKLADAIVGKPFDVELVLAKIGKLIGCGNG
jgi:DNA-binding response OmpR family regulator